MSLIRLSRILRDINLPVYWRHEYAENTIGPYNLTTAMGETIIYTHTFTLRETSHVRCDWKSNAGTAAVAWAVLHLNIYIDGWMVDSSAASCYVLLGQTVYAKCVWLNVPAGAHTVDFKAVATVNDIAMDFYNASIDVCRI